MLSGAPLIAALSVMLLSLVGVIFVSKSAGSWMRKHLTHLATFSAGVFLLVAYALAEEAVIEGGWLVGVGSVLLGAALMEGIHFFLPTKHHHHGHDNDHDHTQIDGRRVLMSDALHNIGDGILLVGAFAASFYVGLAATVGVLVHEAVQEISEYFVLKEAGYTDREALTRNFAVSSTILIGFFLAAYLSSVGFLVAILSGIAAGGFLSVLLHDLLPHALASIKQNGGATKHMIAAFIGAVSMLGVQTLFAHAEIPEMHTEATFKVQPSPREESPSPQTKPAPATTPAATSPTAADTAVPLPATTTEQKDEPIVDITNPAASDTPADGSAPADGTRRE